jgi:hypothetical protein
MELHVERKFFKSVSYKLKTCLSPLELTSLGAKANISWSMYSFISPPHPPVTSGPT